MNLILGYNKGDNYINEIICVKVNKNFAIKLVAEEPVTDIEARVVSCDGGGGALGHPKVYINLVRIFAYKSSQIIRSVLFCQNLIGPTGASSCSPADNTFVTVNQIG